MEDQKEILNTIRESKYQMTDMTDAFKIIELEILNLSKKTFQIDVIKAEQYIIYEDCESPLNIPIFPTSMMDGYAIKVEEINTNLNIEIISKIYAGNKNTVENIDSFKNKCSYVTTGSTIPDWCNCIIPIEYTEYIDKNNIKIISSAQLIAGKFIRKIGCDVIKGEIIMKAGQKIQIMDISLLLSCGLKNVIVYCKPVVGILSTGDEVINIDIFSKNQEISEYLENNPNKIIDSNKEMIKLMLLKTNISNVIDLGQISDEYLKVKEKMESSSKLCDFVISSGGVSMGEKDLIKVFLEKEGKILFGRLNMKPGKPTTFAKFNDTIFFALPGNPVSCYVTYQLLLSYALNLFQNSNKFEYPTIKINILHDIDMDTERPEYQRAIVYFDLESKKFYAKNTGNQQSSRLKSIQYSNGLLLIPKGQIEKKKINEGEELECYLTEQLVTVKTTSEINIIKSQIKKEINVSDECCTMRHSARKSTHHQIKRTFSLGYIIISDRASKGEYKDESGPAFEDFFSNLYDHTFELKEKLLVADEKELIENAIIDLCDNKKLNLIFTSGGTGLTKRDVTPEATQNVIQKEAFGISNYIMSESLKITKMASLSRAIAGIRNSTLIINLPGNPKAVKENLNILHPVLRHALNQVCQIPDFH